MIKPDSAPRFARFLSAAGVRRILTLGLPLLAAAANAATVTVNTTTANSSTDGKCGFVEAVQAINQASTYRSCTYTADGQSDKIAFSVSGTHTITAVTLNRGVEIRGLGQSSTIITSPDFCTICSFGITAGTNTTIWLRDLTLQVSPGSPLLGIWVDTSSALTLATTNVRVSGFGTGIVLSGQNVLGQIASTTLENNGVGLNVVDGAMQVTSSTIRNNTSRGIWLQQTGAAHYNYISSSTIQNNRGQVGAGVKAESASEPGGLPTLDITGCTFSGNQATGDGGGLHVNTETNVTSSVFDNNSAGGMGGGFLAHERDVGYIVEIDTTTFKNNRAAQGAGFSNYGPSDGQRVKVTLRQSTFGPSNVATGDGGGIYSRSQIDTAENVTIHGNTAARGGGLFHSSGGESHLFHCTVTSNRANTSNGGGGLWLQTGNPAYAYNIFADNRAGSGATPPLNNLTVDPGNSSLGARYNLLDNVSGVAHLFPTDSSAGNIVADPQLGTFGFYGGATETRPLLASSPALDAIPAAASDSTTHDQRNIIRPVDGNLNGTASNDIGAVEMNATATMYQAESLTVAAQSGETLTTENHANYSGGQGRVKQANLNGYVTLQTGTIQPGTYGVIVWYKRASNAGRFRLAVGTSAGSTTNLGGETDAYRPSALGAQWTKVNLGTITISTAGARYFQFTATSKNASSSGHWMYLDAIQLYKSN